MTDDRKPGMSWPCIRNAFAIMAPIYGVLWWALT